MSINKEDFDVLKVVELARYKKYEVTSAGFAVIDKLDKIAGIPKKLKTRKNAVQALHVLAEGMLKYDYFSPEERKKLIQEAGMSDAPFKGPKGLFTSSAPVTEDSNEEESIPDEDIKSSASAFDEDEFDDEVDSDSDLDSDEEEEETEEEEEDEEV
jgi:hypothetical protein